MHIHHIVLDSIHGSDFVAERPNGIIDYLLLFIKTPCTMVVDDHLHTIGSPSVILISSNTPYKYFPTGPQYIDDHLHFAVSDKSSFMSELIFPLNIPIQVSNDNCIHSILCGIQQENTPDNKYSGLIINHLISLLLIKVGEQWDLMQLRNTSLPHYSDLLGVRNQILDSPEKAWTIEELAEKAHLSHAYFQVMYKKAFGVTCITDVINAKIAQAKVLLASTNFPVKQISQELGYNDVYHFIRQFKKSTGMTPGAFRKKLYS